MNYYADIVNKGGRELKKANERTSKWLDEIREELTDEAIDTIDGTGYNNMFECFGMCETAEDVNNICRMDFLDDDEKMSDFYALSKEDFLFSYSYLSEEEYDATMKKVLTA